MIGRSVNKDVLRSMRVPVSVVMLGGDVIASDTHFSVRRTERTAVLAAYRLVSKWERALRHDGEMCDTLVAIEPADNVLYVTGQKKFV